MTNNPKTIDQTYKAIKELFNNKGEKYDKDN
jgi:hypothetical protein